MEQKGVENPERFLNETQKIQPQDLLMLQTALKNKQQADLKNDIPQEEQPLKNIEEVAE